ncbi:hypothetical protein PACTADRAFT_31163 [Pachysolen tannophilus NRRL Y-2460]|uniref:Uncharacterized protein n=1 Tax=Pachysolen tannophilus NRRL Y-2460 TaxID=669874 RepID=A0A1E4U184_PACTA|nr:hypothetical protein PACTADRAFT_31163 [Pachysolen tannophilus NRRL Y-2460]
MKIEINNNSDESHKYHCNVLPCRIKYTGEVQSPLLKPETGYWEVTQDQDNKVTTYFRGRLLQGNLVTLDSNYKGYILRQQVEKDEEQEKEINGKKFVNIGEFEKLVIFDNGMEFNGESENLIEEWLNVSNIIHE